MNLKMKNNNINKKLSVNEKERVRETIRSTIKKYWDREGASTYAFCVILFDCMLILSLASKFVNHNIVYGTKEYSLYLGILAIITIVDSIVLNIIFSKMKKKGNEGIFIKLITILALLLVILEIIF